MRVSKWSILICAVLLSGCASWNRETVIEESAYQVLHAVDTAQTINIRKQWLEGSDLYEVDSRWAIGKEPSEGKVIAYMATVAVAHACVTEIMVANDAPKWAIRTWEILSIGVTVDEVGRNYSLGIKF